MIQVLKAPTTTLIGLDVFIISTGIANFKTNSKAYGISICIYNGIAKSIASAIANGGRALSKLFGGRISHLCEERIYMVYFLSPLRITVKHESSLSIRTLVCLSLTSAPALGLKLEKLLSIFFFVS